ncbi:aromatic prenyltransferase (DMATS family) [Aspergillus melleus]|uniref:Aromatic prenyltransferase (DMATS family) n=1 Tax=Aspergillus melleus TaxID=138277 RepID=A0ACC3AQK8_9EURO|nr:aromatic prenyltransferase (DMATS family) [Aspergillus melleus]
MSASAESLFPSSPGTLTRLNGVNGYPAKTQKMLTNGDTDTRDSLSLAFFTPYDVLTTALPLPAPTSSTAFWWRETGPLMSKLLSKANYPLYTHYKYLLLYHTHILPLLGPRPPLENSVQPSPANAPWRSFLTDDFSPLEPSWNVNGNAESQSTIRLGIEPVGFDAGSAADPFNQAAVMRFMHSYAAAEVGANLYMFEHFSAELFVSLDVHPQFRDKLPGSEHTTQSFLAFDLDAGGVTSKAYFFPILKALVTGQSTTKVISDSILRLAQKSSLWGPQAITALSVLEAWMASFNGAAKAEMISVDCVDEADSRIKIYVRIPHTALRGVKEAYSLGGRLMDENTTEAVKLLDDLWRTIFDVADENEELPQNDHRTAGTIFNFELRPGKWFPEPKVYLPVRHYCENDIQIAGRLQKFFGKLGWNQLERGYSKDLEELFPHHPLSTSTGTHTYLSFSYKKQKGVYMTMYYSPRVYSV